MKSITVCSDPQKPSYLVAQETAIREKFNPYSKPVGYWDEVHDDRSVYYYKWNGKILQVTVMGPDVAPQAVNSTPVFDPMRKE